MASKRTLNEEYQQGNDDGDLQVGAKRRHRDPQEAEATNLLAIHSEVFKSVLREVIKEEILPVLRRDISSLRRDISSCHNQQGASSGSRALQLCFVNNLHQRIFTFTNLTAEGGGPLQIELRYAETQQLVEDSTMNVQIYVLDGDFGSDGNEDWTAEQFNSRIVKPRERKGELLSGIKLFKLENGIATINKGIVFTDNSKAIRSGMFRLGVKVVPRDSVGTDIREGRSEPFKVLDKRGKPHEKRDLPALDDKVWRLKRIGNGSKIQKQLSEKGIESVKDLLRLNTTGSLREEFGNCKALDSIIEHAKQCELDDHERYIYHAQEQSISLVFSCIYEIVEVIFRGQNRSLQSLNLEEKRLVERVKQVAYTNLKDLERIETKPDPIVNTLTDTPGTPYGGSEQGYSQPSIPASCTNEGVPDPQPSEREMPPNTDVLDEFAFGMCTEGGNWHLNGLPFPLVQGGSKENESPQNHFPDYWSLFASLESENDFSLGCSVGAEFGSYSGYPNPKAMWYKIHKIRVALKWVILVKTKAAARKAVLM